mgnify:CR=1 FL=1
MPDNDYQDDQEQSETFDETHLDDEGDGDVMLDEADGVLDVTQVDGDADQDEFDEDEPLLDIDDQLPLDGTEAEADALLGVDGERRNQSDSDGEPQSSADEVELVYSGLMENERGAQASAPHWEAKRLSDDDIEDLGYGPDADRPEPNVPGDAS